MDKQEVPAKTCTILPIWFATVFWYACLKQTMLIMFCSQGLPVYKWDDQRKEFRVEPRSHGLQTLQSGDLRCWETKQTMPFLMLTLQKPQLYNSLQHPGSRPYIPFATYFWNILPELSPAPISSGPWRKEVDLCRVPLGWCLNIEDDSSSREQPKRYAAFWAHSWRANCFRPAVKHTWIA